MKYRIKINTPTGIREREIEAKDSIEAMQKASLMGMVVEVKRVYRMNIRGLSFNDRHMFLSRLSAMLGSGVQADKALEIIYNTFSGRIKHVAGELINKMETGVDLPAAIEMIGQPDFPKTVVELIKSASNAMSTYEALIEANRFESEMVEVKKGSKKGIALAFINFGISIAFVVFAVYYMMPMVMSPDIMRIAGDKIDVNSILVMVDWLKYATVALVAVTLFLLFLGTVGKETMPNLSDKIILSIPVYRDLMLAQKHYVIFYSMGLLVGVGVQLEAVIKLLYESTPKGALKNDFLAAKVALEKGLPWPPELKTIHATDRAALSASQDRQQTAMALNIIAAQYKEIYIQRAKMFVPALQTIGMVFILISGFIMFSVTILPLLQTLQGVL